MASHLSKSTHSFYMILREVFSRLVFSLQIDSSLSMEIIAFWLWLEGNGQTDLFESLISFDGTQFEAIAFTAKSFVETISPDLSDLDAGSIQRSPFQKQVIEGVAFYLNSICYEVLEDLREKAEMKEFSDDQINRDYEESLNGEAPVTAKDLLSRIKSLYSNTEEHVEASSSRNIQPTRSRILQDIREETRDEYQYSTPDLATLFDTMSLSDRRNSTIMQQQYDDVPLPSDERTLFVTFSNGYPFSKDELYDFFMRHYGDIQNITIEDPPEPRPPLFAHITFFSQSTLRRVLDGNRRVKFITRGKHLWARQFVPKKKKNEG